MSSTRMDYALPVEGTPSTEATKTATTQTRTIVTEDPRKFKSVGNSSDIGIPLAGVICSFILPPAGWFGYLFALKCNRPSRRYKWALISLKVGSVLSFVYVFVAASLLSYFLPDIWSDSVAQGCGYQGPCPMF